MRAYVDGRIFDPERIDQHVEPGTFRLHPQGQYTMRTYFRPDATGKTVFHCHILPHEDQGMMANLLIVAAAGGGP